jgi:hypothetical protein
MHGLVFLPIIFILYLLPTILAFSKNHHNRVAIGAVNLLLGWTVLGWIVAFIWSLTAPPPREVIYVQQPPNGPLGNKHRQV